MWILTTQPGTPRYCTWQQNERAPKKPKQKATAALYKSKEGQGSKKEKARGEKEAREARARRARGAAPGVTLLSYQSAIGIGWSVERGTSRRREAERSGRRPLRRCGGYNILRSNRQAIGVWRDETEGGKANRRREGGEEGIVSVEFVWPTCLAESCIQCKGGCCRHGKTTSLIVMRTTIWQKRSPLIGIVIASAVLLNQAHAVTYSTSSSHARRLSQTSSVADVYDANTARGSNSFFNVACGIIAGIAVLYGALFFVDRETFTEITGQASLVPDSCNCKCKKHLIDQDDEDITEFERDMAAKAIATGRDDDEASSPYLTLETIDYLREKQDQAVEKPKRMLLSLFQKCKPRKVIDESDKYRTPNEGDIYGIGSCPPNAAMSTMFETVETVTNVFQEMRLKLCWTPAKQYDTQDKYKLSEEVAVGSKDDDDTTVEIIDVQRQPSSYESDPHAPW